MEIWPPGHKSPIHEHGNACAVIRVLTGKIQCTWYNTIDEGVKPVAIGQPVQLNKDQFTWLGENQYQIHALENITEETCVTLQCYEFAAKDDLHEERFRFIEQDTDKRQDFVPNSDCTFTEFNNHMMYEWATGQPCPFHEMPPESHGPM